MAFREFADWCNERAGVSMTDNESISLEKAMFILRHGSAEGEHKYFEAIDIIEKEINRQKAEIERLKEENERYKECNRIIAYQRGKSNDEIQKLHSELKSLKRKLKKLLNAIMKFAENE